MSVKLRTRAVPPYLRERYGFVITERTLANRAWDGTGPKFYKAGNRRYYDPVDLDEWVAEQLGEARRSTSYHPPAKVEARCLTSDRPPAKVEARCSTSDHPPAKVGA